MGERDDARHQVEQKRERMSRIAHEVSRRMTPDYAKERAREMARDRMMRVRDRAVENSWFAPLLGAGIGALVAKALQSRTQDRGYRGDGAWYREDDWERGRHYGSFRPPRYGRDDEIWPEDDRRGALSGSSRDMAGESQSSGIGEKATEMKDRAAGAAADMKETISSKAGEVKDRLSETATHLRERLPDRERIRASAYDDTGVWALGAMALGALFGFALPVSERERELLEPARRKARELGEQAKEMALEKGSEAMDKATASVESAGEQRSSTQMPGGDVAPLH
jgi:hypothetical protein